MIKKCLFLALLASSVPALANVYSISIDTSTLSGAGSLYFSFDRGASPFDLATATVSGFTGGGTLGAAITPPGPGILPGALVLNNSTPALYQQAITYNGSKIKFFLALTGPAISSPNPGAIGGTDFALFLLDGADNGLLTDDPTGSVLGVSIAPGTGAVSFATFQNSGAPSVVSITAIPEPGSILSLVSGIVMMCALARGRIAG